jgi:tRNA-2-methylthio-N6-dimethylallyladenosine synthase
MSHCIIESLPEMKLARSRVEKAKLIREEIIVPTKVAAFAKGRKYLIKTFGCQANVRDEEVLSGYLEKAGFIKTEVEAEANLVIINTCAVRENAEDKVYGEIGKFKANHQKDKNFILCVSGCMMQEEKLAEKLMASYPYVNIIFGTHNVPEILNLIDEHLSKKKDLVKVLSFPGDIVENLPSIRLDPYKAFVNISYGCDKFCTYCIVPYTRGRERSRPLTDILKECQDLIDQGYQEITLLGQNVNSYGKDFNDGTSFATVLEAVAKLGIPRLRFMTSHPWDFKDEMLDVIAKYPNIMKCIHLPVQSGNDEILKAMGRRYTREQYLDLVRRIREKIPGVALTTDIIVGFPNETLAQFEDTLSLCEQVQYDAAFTFIYSPRKGTPAAAIKDNVSDADKHERFDRLLKVIEAGVMAHSKTMLGRTYLVLVDGPSKKDETMLSGYTEKNKLINFKGPAYLKGSIVPVKIIEDHAFSMIGELVEDPLLSKAKTLADAMKEEPLLKEFLATSAALEKDPSVLALREETKVAERQMVSLAKAYPDEYVGAKKKYDDLMARYLAHPLVKNYQALHDDVATLLSTISGALQ